MAHTELAAMVCLLVRILLIDVATDRLQTLVEGAVPAIGPDSFYAVHLRKCPSRAMESSWVALFSREAALFVGSGCPFVQRAAGRVVLLAQNMRCDLPCAKDMLVRVLEGSDGGQR
ncbi:hypothetical protein [Streptomyces lancefieldiae]|uniref:Uncharacterized protein n=1 Tax=Streptomyces lancefieldiae TaxID=3075520 RepID=A0ABU3AT45_9ACTN|nr:hypothetical protein [Streptomyces sp. DSM 40712]MDT0612238.1 hypothetical protein [Streptomyces sp. DSM 40712]